MKNCTCDKLDCDTSCLCECHREKTELEKDLIKFDDGPKELIPEIFPELTEPNNELDEAVDACIEKMQKYNLKKVVIKGGTK